MCIFGFVLLIFRSTCAQAILTIRENHLYKISKYICTVLCAKEYPGIHSLTSFGSTEPGILVDVCLGSECAFGRLNVFKADATLRPSRIDAACERSSRHRALRNTRRRPAAWSPSGTPLGLDPGRQCDAGKSGRQAERVIGCLSSASSTGARSKVIAEQPAVGLKKDYIYIRDRQLFWFGDGRYLHLMHNGILHFQHKALEATKWIFDLGLSPRYTTERLEKLKTLSFFFTFLFNWGFVQHEGTEKHNNCI